MPINFNGNGGGMLRVVASAGGGGGAQGPQGYQGPQGDAGAQGPQGNQGTQGAQGNQGFQGTQGSQGTQGNQGFQGPQGPQGTQGVQGSQGNQGVTGMGFVIAKVYNSEAERIAATGGALPADGEFALIAGSLSQSDPDYGSLYLYKTSGGWTYQTDMSVQGIQGPQGSQGTQGSSANTSYDISSFYSGTPGNAEVMMQHVVGRAFSLSTAINDIKAGCLVNPTANADIKLSKKSGGTETVLAYLRLATNGSLSYRNSTNSDVFSGSLNAAFSVGDFVILTAPATAVADLADIYVTLIGTVS